MNLQALQQAIDRIVPIRARVLGLEFQAAPCDGQYLVLPDGKDGKGRRRELKRLTLYRPCAPTLDAVTDTALEMLSRLHERFGPGKVWTLGNSGASKRIHVIAADGLVRTNEAGEIMLRMFYVHEHSTIAPHEEDLESKWPWSEVPRQYIAPTCPLCGQPCDRIEVGGVKVNGCPCVGNKVVAIAGLNDDLKAGRIKVPDDPWGTAKAEHFRALGLA